MFISVTTTSEIILSDVKPTDARDLYEELHQWTPSGGWSELAEDLFRSLRQAGAIRESE
jgi:hypothetical protein